MEKEKSVLTEDEVKDLCRYWSGKHLIEYTERLVLANYNKGLRGKAKIEVKESNKERERANKENLSSEASFFEGRISAFCWLLKELGEK